MKRVMIDLETLGTAPGCVVLSIGAVEFDDDGAGPEVMTCVINKADSLRRGLAVDPNTEAWWEKQSEEARCVLAMADDPALSRSLVYALGMFEDYLVRRGGPDGVEVWGNGADFDNAILAACYRAVGLEAPWKFWNNRCYRTLKALHPEIKLERVGTYHNALDDAVTQAEHATRLLRFHNAVRT